MAQNNKTTMSYAFKSFFEREKLTGSQNFNDWYRSLRIVLRVTDQLECLHKPCSAEPTAETSTDEEKALWKAEYKTHNDVAYLMLGAITPALQKQFENYFPMDVLNELRKMFEKPQTVEVYDLMKSLHGCKQAEGEPVSAHVLKMKGYMDQLQALGKVYEQDISINLINRSLTKEFSSFVRNFNMHCVGKTVSDLHALFIDYEKGLPPRAPTPQVLAIQGGRINKPNANKKGKGKGKQFMAYQPQPKKNPPKKKDNPKKDQACHYCHVVGHWKRNCPFYIRELRESKNKTRHLGASTSGV